MANYLMVSEALINYIKENKLKIGDKLPPEEKLAILLKVSRLTLREALGQLKGKGLFYSKQGSGTFVSGNVKEIAGTLNKNLGMTEMLLETGLKPGVSYYEVDLIKATNEYAEKLKVKEGSGIVMCTRVRTADNKPVVLSIDYLTPRIAIIFLSIHDKDISLFGMIEDNNIIIGNSFAEIYPENCSKQLAEKLSYKEGAPILVLKQTIMDNKGTPLFYGEEYFRPDCFKFSINRKRNNI